MSDELTAAFYTEAEDILARVENDFKAWLQGDDPKAAVQALFRGFHTIKGNSSFLTLPKITSVAHEAENLLDLLRKEKIKVSTDVIECLLLAIDAMRVLICERDENFSCEPVLAHLHNFLQKEKPASDSSAAITSHKEENKSEALASAPGAPSSVAAPSSSSHGAPAAAKNIIRIGEDKIDKIIDLSQELELSRFMLERIQDQDNASESIHELMSSIARVSRISRTLAGLVHGVRLVAVGTIFQRFPRVVKELADKLGKKVELLVEGGGTELDKSIVDAITEPLTHMIRNSLDHGIESTAIRQQNNKPEQGRIILKGYVKSNFVFIDIIDDGAGIDGERVARKAVEKGLINEAQASALSLAEKRDLIFAPGFSTAETVTDISGRGVGMDVVRTSIARLNGVVSIDSIPGQGTTIHLRFPLSKVVRYSIFVRAGTQVFALPLERAFRSLDQELTLAPADGAAMGEDHIAVYSLAALQSTLIDEASPATKPHIVFFRKEDESLVGLQVDDYIATEEVVVQAVDAFVAARCSIQGATVRKDGTLCPMLDIDQIIARAPAAALRGYIPVASVRMDNLEKTADEILAA